MHALSDASRSTLTRRGWSGAVARRVSDVASLLRRYRDEEAAFVISNAVVNVANFGFFIAVGRLFSSSSYGAITALLSIVTVANTPLNAIQAGVVHATVAVHQTLGARSPRHLVITFALVGVAATMVVGAAAVLVERFFSLSSVVPVLMLALWFAPSVVNSALCGSLMGHFRFRAIAVANVVGALTRIVLVVVFGAAHQLFGLSGPVIATSAGIAVTTLWVFVAVRAEPDWRLGEYLELHLRHTLWAFLSLGGFAAFVAVDVALARHLLSPISAGSYAAASTAGKIALFLSVAVPIVAYPRFAAHHAAGTNARRPLLLSFWLVAGLGLATAAIMSALPTVTVDLLFGHRYAAAAPLLRLLAPEGAAMGVVGLMTYYHVAQRSVWAAVPWLGVVTIVLVTSFGDISAHALALLVLITSIAVGALMALPEIQGAWRSSRVAHTRTSGGTP